MVYGNIEQKFNLKVRTNFKKILKLPSIAIWDDD